MSFVSYIRNINASTMTLWLLYFLLQSKNSEYRRMHAQGLLANNSSGNVCSVRFREKKRPYVFVPHVL